VADEKEDGTFAEEDEGEAKSDEEVSRVEKDTEEQDGTETLCCMFCRRMAVLRR